MTAPSPTWRHVTLIVMVGLAPRLAIIALAPSGHPGDMRGWMEAAQFVARVGYPHAYGEALPGNNYPPLFLLFLWAVGHTYTLCCSSHFFWPTCTLDVLMRLGPAAVDSSIAALIYSVSLSWSSKRAALLAGLAYALNPSILADVAYYSMIGDPLYLAFTFLAFVALAKRRFTSCIALMVLAVLTKPQAGAFLPLCGSWIFLKARPRQFVAGGAVALATAIAIYLPFLAAGTMEQAIHGIVRMGGTFPLVHVRAANLWYLLFLGRDPFGASPPYDSYLLLGVISYRDIGLIAFGVLNIAVFLFLVRCQVSWALFAAASVLGLGSFLFCTRMHVNYSYPVVAFLCGLVTFGSWHIVGALALVTLASLLNWLAVGVPLHLAACVIYLVSFATLLLAVRSLVVGQGGYKLDSWQFRRVGIARWAFLAGGLFWIGGALGARLVRWDDPLLLDGGLSLTVGVLALLMFGALDRVIRMVPVERRGAI